MDVQIKKKDETVQHSINLYPSWSILLTKSGHNTFCKVP